MSGSSLPSNPRREDPPRHLRLGDLADAGHDVIWAGNWSEDPGDIALLQRAKREGRILVTLDKDFGELAVVQGQRHAGIIRLVGFSARQQGQAIASILDRYGDELRSGALVTADRGRTRIRPPDP